MVEKLVGDTLCDLCGCIVKAVNRIGVVYNGEEYCSSCTREYASELKTPSQTNPTRGSSITVQ